MRRPRAGRSPRPSPSTRIGRRSEAELRELRKQVTFALLRVEDDVEKVTATVEALFNLLRKSFKP